MIFHINKSLDNEIKKATEGLEIWVRWERQMMNIEFWFGTSCETPIFWTNLETGDKQWDGSQADRFRRPEVNGTGVQWRTALLFSDVEPLVSAISVFTDTVND